MKIHSRHLSSRPAIAFGSFYMAVRSQRDPEQLAAAMRSKLRELDAVCRLPSLLGRPCCRLFCFLSQMATVSLGVLGIWAACCRLPASLEWLAYSVSKRLRELEFASPWARSARNCCRQRWAAIEIAGYRFGDRIDPRTTGDQGAGFHCVSGDPRDPLCWAALCSPCCSSACWHMDSSATRTVGRSFDPAPRGVNRLS